MKIGILQSGRRIKVMAEVVEQLKDGFWREVHNGVPRLFWRETGRRGAREADAPHSRAKIWREKVYGTRPSRAGYPLPPATLLTCDRVYVCLSVAVHPSVCLSGIDSSVYPGLEVSRRRVGWLLLKRLSKISA